MKQDAISMDRITMNGNSGLEMGLTVSNLAADIYPILIVVENVGSQEICTVERLSPGIISEHSPPWDLNEVS